MSNQAAWLMAVKEKPFKVGEAPMPTPDANEVVIRNHAVAINPADAAQQDKGILIASYPHILGCDAAGTIVAVGSSVQTFKPGDRVIAGTNGSAYMEGLLEQKSTNAAFQLYCGTDAKLVARLPDSISYTQGCVLPLAISTAASGMFEKDTMALPFPDPQAKPVSNGKVLLIWGGSSSVGSCAIQLARGAGFEVATTASASNFDHCREVGAKYVFDRAKDSVVDDVVAGLKGTNFEGVFSAIFQPDVIMKCTDILTRLGGSNKVLGSVYPPGFPDPEGIPSGITLGRSASIDIIKTDVGPATWGKWVPAALENGTLKCKPEPVIVGTGLEKIQEACDKMLAGVSALKLVVELP